MKQDIVQVKLFISVPKSKWLHIFNKKFPDVVFRILSKFLLDDNTGYTLFEIHGLSADKLISEFKLLGPIKYKILYEGPKHVIFDVKSRDPWILNSLVKHQLLILYPILIQECKLNIEAITERTKVDDFLNELERQNIVFKIKSIGYYSQTPLLTQKQHEILKIAFNRGYFDIPRKISLSNLAGELGISASALSELIRRISKNLAKNYLTFKN